MNTLILIVLVVGAAVGFYHGAFKQIANLIGVVAGLVLASTLYQHFGDFLASHSGTSQTVGHMFAFVLIVIIVPIVLGWIATILTKIVSSIHLGFINRLCGAGIGVVSYGLVLSFACNFMDFIESNMGYNPEKLEQRENLYYTVKHSSQFVIPDMLIVTDSTEVANGAEPMYGIRPTVQKTINNAIDTAAGAILGTSKEE